MFTVIEQQQGGFVREILHDDIQRVTRGIFFETQGRQDRLRNQVRRQDGSQINKPDAAGIVLDLIRRQLQSQTRFTRAAGASQGEQAPCGHPLRHLRQFLLAADEAG
ncbi:MAG: hypothetical protein BWY76_00860 [bacterium ADurb.Bin429]|nr:MAG: hypothetical protein BWY76_00860 [bacterium ADurb.Bin429]